MKILFKLQIEGSAFIKKTMIRKWLKRVSPYLLSLLPWIIYTYLQ